MSPRSSLRDGRLLDPARIDLQSCTAGEAYGISQRVSFSLSSPERTTRGRQEAMRMEGLRMASILKNDNQATSGAHGIRVNRLFVVVFRKMRCSRGEGGSRAAEGMSAIFKERNWKRYWKKKKKFSGKSMIVPL